MKYFAPLLLALILASCISVGKLATASGKPEILIENKTSKQVIDAIAAFAPTKGFQADKITDYGITAVGSSAVSNIFGDKLVPATNNYSVVQQGANVKVYLIQFRTYPQDASGNYNYDTGAIAQTSENNSQSAYEMLQQQLVELKNFIH